MNPKKEEYRKFLVDSFVNALKENQLDWKKGWSTSISTPINAINGRPYKGINSFSLMMAAAMRGTDDQRWCTFKQIQDKGWKLKKGSKHMTVEYWMPYDKEIKKFVTWAEYNAFKDKKHYEVYPKYYNVFNGKDIEGIPELIRKTNPDVKQDEIIEKLKNNMKISIEEDGGISAFYRITDDSIHLPRKETFASSYEYNATALHEFSHATGAKHRLNRDMGGGFGTSSYAREELVAEISSAFMSARTGFEQTAAHIDNHKAYVQNWIKMIQEKQDVLFDAIKDAEQAANYLELQAELITEKEYIESLGYTKRVEVEPIQEESLVEIEGTQNHSAEDLSDKYIYHSPLEYEGDVDIEFSINNYVYGGSCSIALISDGEPYANMTVNLENAHIPETWAFLDTNNLPGIDKFVEDYDLGKFTGLVKRSGYCEYPLYELNMNKLEKLAYGGTPNRKKEPYVTEKPFIEQVDKGKDTYGMHLYRADKCGMFFVGNYKKETGTIQIEYMSDSLVDAGREFKNYVPHKESGIEKLFEKER